MYKYEVEDDVKQVCSCDEIQSSCVQRFRAGRQMAVSQILLICLDRRQRLSVTGARRVVRIRARRRIWDAPRETETRCCASLEPPRVSIIHPSRRAEPHTRYRAHRTEAGGRWTEHTRSDGRSSTRSCSARFGARSDRSSTTRYCSDVQRWESKGPIDSRPNMSSALRWVLSLCFFIIIIFIIQVRVFFKSRSIIITHARH